MNIKKRLEANKKPFYSLEFFPPKDQSQWPNFFDTVEKLLPINPLFSSVTYGAAGSSQDATLAIVTKLKQLFQIETMAHLTCVGATKDSITHFIEQLEKNDIHNVLALRGDLPANSLNTHAINDFTYASDLVHFTKKHFPNCAIGVAGYPAPHPESPSFCDDWLHTVSKIQKGADFVITQIFFDVREYFHFVERLDAMGVNVPVIPGILPIESLNSLNRTLALCGANIPGKLYLDLVAADKQGGSSAVKEAGILFATQQIRALLNRGAPGIHLYTLNHAETCLRIIKDVGVIL